MLRAGILAKSLGLNYNGLGSKTKFYFYVSAIIREYIGIIYLNLNKKYIICNYYRSNLFLKLYIWKLNFNILSNNKEPNRYRFRGLIED